MPRTPRPAHERVLAKVVQEGDCWTFTGFCNAKGYGLISVGTFANPKRGRAHRVVYEHFKGPIPAGLTIDHLCFNCACVNPEHLEAVTALENIRRRRSTWNGAKTHCKYGHPFDERNTMREGTKRICRICRRKRDRARYAKRKV